MSTSTLRFIITLILIAHGLGHAIGILAVAGIKLSSTHSSTSWLLTKLLGDSAIKITSSVIWLIAIIGFVGAGMGIQNWIVSQDYWQNLAKLAAIVSLVGLILFWNAFPFFIPNKAGIILVDMLVIISLYWIQWPRDLLTNH